MSPTTNPSPLTLTPLPPPPHTHTGVHTMLVEFRVKFYMPDPGSLHEEVTRYQFYLQVKKDLYTTRYGACSCPRIYMYICFRRYRSIIAFRSQACSVVVSKMSNLCYMYSGSMQYRSRALYMWVTDRSIVGPCSIGLELYTCGSPTDLRDCAECLVFNLIKLSLNTTRPQTSCA